MPDQSSSSSSGSSSSSSSSSSSDGERSPETVLHAELSGEAGESSDYPGLDGVERALDLGRSDDDAGGGNGGEKEEDDYEDAGFGMEEEEDDDVFETLKKRQKMFKTAPRIRMQPQHRLPQGDGKFKNASAKKGRLLAVQQAIGGLICHDCGATWSKGWETALLEGEDDPVILCAGCDLYRRRYKQKRPGSAVRRMERRRVEMLMYSHHSSWGSMDLLRADPRIISGLHPLSRAPDHLFYTPLSHEQAVCLSSAYYGSHNYHSSFEIF